MVSVRNFWSVIFFGTGNIFKDFSLEKGDWQFPKFGALIVRYYKQ